MNSKIEKTTVLERIVELTGCSEKQLKNLEEFVEFLLEQNQHFNFIGKSTIETIWQRHILDCAQLFPFISKPVQNLYLQRAPIQGFQTSDVQAMPKQSCASGSENPAYSPYRSEILNRFLDPQKESSNKTVSNRQKTENSLQIQAAPQKVSETKVTEKPEFLKVSQKFADFGAGAGLPGMVLSILGLKEVHLVEKSFRKADFLRQAKSFSQNRVFVHQKKIEDLQKDFQEMFDKNRLNPEKSSKLFLSDNGDFQKKALRFDCIVSRAFAPLPKLLGYCQNFLSSKGHCLFLKGKNLSAEIAEAKTMFDFEFELFPSITSEESRIILVKKIRTHSKSLSATGI